MSVGTNMLVGCSQLVPALLGSLYGSQHRGMTMSRAVSGWAPVTAKERRAVWKDLWARLRPCGWPGAQGMAQSAWKREGQGPAAAAPAATAQALHTNP